MPIYEKPVPIYSSDHQTADNIEGESGMSKEHEDDDEQELKELDKLSADVAKNSNSKADSSNLELTHTEADNEAHDEHQEHQP